jgi:RHS repeat-associated protein
MQLASQHFTLVLGIDIHINTLPPFNPLHPFIGLVLDPMDYIPFIGGTVYINGRQRGVSDTGGMLITWQHIPLFTGPFALMPMIGHESINFYGSVNTFADGSRLSPTAHMVMSCNDIGIPLSLQPGKKIKRPIPSLYAPTSVAIPIPSGPPVMVGGPYVPDWGGALKNLVMGFGFGAVMKVAGKAGKKMLKKAMTALNHSVLKKMDCTKGLSEKFCKLGFEPVDLITGRVLYSGVDFDLPGPLPLAWQRHWYSDSGMSGVLGYGTHLCYDLKLEVFQEQDCIGVTLPDGRAAGFERILPGASFFNRIEQLTLTNHGKYYSLFNHESRLTYTFEPTTEFITYAITGVTLASPSQHLYQLTRIENELGHAIRFAYRHNHLYQITDSAHRVLDITTDPQGRITQVSCGQHLLIAYGYNEQGDLNAITDALGKTTQIEYDNHLMVQKTDRNGQIFYWEYDAPATGGRCVHTWGEGGILEGWLSYHPGFTEVSDSLGRTTFYAFNADQQCTQITHPGGGHTLYEYNNWGELYREIDPDGKLTGYHYDEQGRKTGVTHADGSTFRYSYDEAGRLMMVTDALGANQIWVYDEQGKLTSTISPEGAVTLYTYNEQHLIHTIRDAKGQVMKLAYDEQYNLREVTLPDGSVSTWYYDSLGRCVQTARSGQLQTFSYDALGRITHVQLPDSNQIQLKYNAYEEVVEAKDHRHHVRFAYTPMGSLKLREQNGSKVHFHYNKQEELLAIANEKGERYRFSRNEDGQVIKETGFDGLERGYQRSKGGKVLKVERPGKRWTEYQYDPAGRVVRTEYSDGSWEIYSYNKNGELIAARNETSELQLERDVVGRVIKEVQDGYQVESRFDKMGQRTGVSSSLGALLDVAYNELGQVSQLNAKQGEGEAWQAKLHYNSLGLETERVISGGLSSKWAYDSAGRPLEHQVGEGKQTHRHKRYQWGVNNRLHQILNELTQGSTHFKYDSFDTLISAIYPDYTAIFRTADVVGNLFQTEEKTDRQYGAGGKLLESKQANYHYDAEGNLTEKTLKNGKQWKYEYYGNGLLKQVTRPDHKKVQFEYDPLGRRTAKVFDNAITRWLWDGNTPLHEWKYDLNERPKLVIDEWGQVSKDKAEPVESLITWVFDEGSFKPAAKLLANEQYSIITDHLGTPCEAYTPLGKKVWECELDIYGKVRNLQGDQGFVPFRYQGQYEDQETGLYYNRFRYYSPEEGLYLSQDPIGVAGNNPNFYAYVHDPNNWVDPFGLDLVTVYHYTSDKGFKGISGSGVIKAQDPGARGKGAIDKPKAVYVTKVKPEDLQKSGMRGKMGLTGDKSTHFIAFEVEESALKKLDPQDKKLRLYIEGDVNLRDSNNKLKSDVSMGKVCK